MQLNEKGLYLVVIWPSALPYLDIAHKEVLAFGGEILCTFTVHPSAEALTAFLTEIYSSCQFDRDRLEEKKSVIVSDLSHTGIELFLFSKSLGRMVWDNDRGRNISPAVMALKETMRRKIEQKGLFSSTYETLHMTDDSNEFTRDFSAALKMMAHSAYTLQIFENSD